MAYKTSDKVRIVASLVLVVTGLVVERYSNVWAHVRHSDWILTISFMLFTWGAILIGYAWGHHSGRQDGRREFAKEVLKERNSWRRLR